MCGIFVLAARHAQHVAPWKLLELATLAARRGCHAWGLAWTDGRQWTATHGTGRFPPASLASVPSTARCVIGHARLATSGDAHDLALAQPIMVQTPRGSVLLAHNGNAPNALACAPDAPSDSVALADLAAERYAVRGGPRDALVHALTFVGAQPVALVLGAPGMLEFYADRLPLYVDKDDAGVYLCSMAFGSARPVPERQPFSLPLPRPVDVTAEAR